METITPSFKNEEDKNIVLLSIILSVFVAFVAPLIVMLCFNDKLSDNSKEINKAFLNLSLVVFLAGFILSVVPIIGWIILFILSPIVLIAYLIIVVLACINILNNQPVKVPVLFKLIK